MRLAGYPKGTLEIDVCAGADELSTLSFAGAAAFLRSTLSRLVDIEPVHVAVGTTGRRRLAESECSRRYYGNGGLTGPSATVSAPDIEWRGPVRLGQALP
jgi:hypothetical protein